MAWREERVVNVLVTAATKYGATGEIARALGEVLTERGLDVRVIAPEQVEEIDGYDAVVLGSAVYAGHWLKPARELVDERATPWRPGRCGCFPAARSATRPSPRKTLSTSRGSCGLPRPESIG